MTDMRFSDDQSLQSWGSSLSDMHEAAEEVARLFAEAEAARDRFNQGTGRRLAQAENDLPVSDRLTSEMQSLHSRAGDAHSADTWRAIAADADTLPTIYRREHETDEDRLHTPRKSLAAEKRADVTHAASEL